jgi:hypothetical protein
MLVGDPLARNGAVLKVAAPPRPGACENARVKRPNQRWWSNTSLMRVQSGVLVPLGYGKYVRSDRVTAIVPIEEERGPGRRTFIFLEDQKEPLVASRAEDSVIRDLVREPQEITRARQQQELLRDIGEDLATVNETLRQIVRDRSRLDLDLLERRIKDVLEETESGTASG